MHNFKGLSSEMKNQLGAFLSEFSSPNILRLYKACGLDFVIVDCEHGYFDFPQVAALAAISKGFSLPMIVRVPSVSREYIQKYLDAGVDGILVPMTNTAEQIAQAVQYAKYSPQGARGISTMRPHSEYAPGELTQLMRNTNEQIKIFAQIETRQGVANVSKILETEGVSGVFVGPNDLSIDFEQPGQYFTELMDEAIHVVFNAAKKVHKTSGIITSNMNLILNCKKIGMTMFSYDSEIGLLAKSIKNSIKEFNI